MGIVFKQNNQNKQQQNEVAKKSLNENNIGKPVKLDTLFILNKKLHTFTLISI